MCCIAVLRVFVFVVSCFLHSVPTEALDYLLVIPILHLEVRSPYYYSTYYQAFLDFANTLPPIKDAINELSLHVHFAVILVGSDQKVQHIS